MTSLDIYTEVERFQFVPKRFEGELRFHIIRECIPVLSSRKRETLPVIVLSGLGSGYGWVDGRMEPFTSLNTVFYQIKIYNNIKIWFT